MTTNRDPELHVVLGAGQVGRQLAERLAARGLRVRSVRRGEAAPLAGIEAARADLSDPDAAAASCAGATVIYDCTNPASYASWRETLPPLKRGVREAAKRTGAFLVVLDNLYVFGRPEGGGIDEGTPMRPCSEKGTLRAELADELFTDVARGELSACVGRASDFFGPGAADMSFYGERFVRALAGGWPAPVLGDPDLPRSYSYVPDVVRGLAAMGEQRERAAGETFLLPVAWRNGTTRELVARFGAPLGRTPRLLPLPRWLFRALGLVSRDLGAVAEMIYQWEIPYVVDDARFARTFGVHATRVEDAIAGSLAAAGVGPAVAIDHSTTSQTR